ncbi:MAG TPA: aminotransferase class I/II-fold pyridoxal phosphate-dependent enzyme [Bacteroidia bacterium]|nr:aminotransferase class I/II-fold pyridoxal phosphate-dependent enzyme [Flavobacterium piscis]NLJ07157.1 aminotransferase class I/II-fold pyridoxal phosphate-dependent enzyme [Sphingobacteriales bacterium]HPD64592.1 aminotransferase class I/II-fold pyridoxal phosphate-dependent enzyme [Bacteroidia bacterium]HRS58526.1 aminotransferase class I/II-fold pyridoxal phosphate-dependent enzyme [Bacteroidia bacterium]HRU69046.1 aminotransferase class I/II-fold pyridoxal phosphate-dependent enzyme [Ba
MDIFEKITKRPGPLGQFSDFAHGYFMFPELEGEISNRMKFRGKEKIVWSLNNYLGLANHPEVRAADAEASKQFGLATPMGARMMSGDTKYHQQLEKELAEFVRKEDAFLLNYGYQGVISILDALLDRHDILVYDAEAHACIVDGARLHIGKRFAYRHNDMESLEKQLQHATQQLSPQGGILVVTEGVYGMSGDQGKIKEIVELKKKYKFRLFIDDAHGFGVMGPRGEGTHVHQGVADGVDIYFATFAKAMASIGAFVASHRYIITHLRYNMRSQTYAKSLPLPLVIGDLKRLEIIKRSTELKDKLWKNVNKLQEGLKARGFDIGKTNSCVTPVYLKGSVNEAGNLIIDLRENYDIFCSVVLYPVIPKGEIIIRIVTSSEHTDEDIEKTLNAFSEVAEKLKNKVYDNENLALDLIKR